jgi:hypothetical protein
MMEYRRRYPGHIRHGGRPLTKDHWTKANLVSKIRRAQALDELIINSTIGVGQDSSQRTTDLLGLLTQHQYRAITESGETGKSRYSGKKVYEAELKNPPALIEFVQNQMRLRMLEITGIQIPGTPIKQEPAAPRPPSPLQEMEPPPPLGPSSSMPREEVPQPSTPQARSPGPEDVGLISRHQDMTMAFVNQIHSFGIKNASMEADLMIAHSHTLSGDPTKDKAITNEMTRIAHKTKKIVKDHVYEVARKTLEEAKSGDTTIFSLAKTATDLAK